MRGTAQARLKRFRRIYLQNSVNNSKIIEIDNAKNASDVVKGINTYMESENWARPLLYIKVHTDLNKKYVYMVTW